MRIQLSVTIPIDMVHNITEFAKKNDISKGRAVEEAWKCFMASLSENDR